ncbi:nuclear transport factor 2 family protein [Burkholderia sp. USMB20]|uniref:nuclear transport factor 2 family protein n=1 Tax=Burkholderia sp. USMB20 TaxID=1571773 RepID=UPI0005CE77BC|nr:nuclear transport factor 2 family protein [Burkholderia sp. USMB20]TGN98705.1 hypothetical protein PL79_006665 [Burkholderia sp. USMB20]
MSLSIVKQFYECAAVGRFADALSLFAPDGEIVFPGPSSIPMAGRFQGSVQILSFFDTVAASLDVLQFAPERFIDGGESIAVAGRERSRVRATGLTFDVPWVQLWTVRENQIVNLADYFETDSMARAFEGRVHTK